jgi:hypothetical protein
MQALIHGQFVTVAGWRRAYAFSTIAGYAASYGGDPAEARATALGHGHDIAWTVNPGTALLGDRGAAKAMLDREAAELAGATIVADGEAVEIDGERFIVKVMGERYSDPIHFKVAA